MTKTRECDRGKRRASSNFGSLVSEVVKEKTADLAWEFKRIQLYYEAFVPSKVEIRFYIYKNGYGTISIIDFSVQDVIDS